MQFAEVFLLDVEEQEHILILVRRDLLLVPERHQRIDFRRTPRRDVARKQGY